MWKSHLILSGDLSGIIFATNMPVYLKSVKTVVEPLRMSSLIGDEA